MFTKEDLETLTASQRTSRVRRIAGNYLFKVAVAAVIVETVAYGFSKLDSSEDN